MFRFPGSGRTAGADEQAAGGRGEWIGENSSLLVARRPGLPRADVLRREA